MNALEAGQIDGVDNVQPSLVATIEGNPNVYVLITNPTRLTLTR